MMWHDVTTTQYRYPDGKYVSYMYSYLQCYARSIISGVYHSNYVVIALLHIGKTYLNSYAHEFSFLWQLIYV